MVKVVDFALRGGKVAIHCHAGLGRTGVLIACYLVYSQRMSGDEAITHVRSNRCVAVEKLNLAVEKQCTPNTPSPLHTLTSLSLHTTCPDPAQSRHAPRLRLCNSLMSFSVHCGTSTLHRQATLPPSPPRLRSTSTTSPSCYTGQRRET